MPALIRVVLLIALYVGLSGCEVLGGEDDGPSTVCEYSYAGVSVASDFGMACATGSECAHGTCMIPGANGNITNEVFAFCTRGCDCESSDHGTASLPSTDPDDTCVYPGGCFIGASQGAWRYAAPKCTTVDDCTAIDARYTHCKTTDSSTVLDDQTCGSLTRVCQAHAPP